MWFPYAAPFYIARIGEMQQVVVSRCRAYVGGFNVSCDGA
jgi:hypothetical protein